MRKARDALNATQPRLSFFLDRQAGQRFAALRESTNCRAIAPNVSLWIPSLPDAPVINFTKS
jgi:hypothetical protein